MLVSQFTNAFIAVPSLPSDAVIASDKKNNSVFYGASGASFFLSTDGGKTFTAKGSLGSSTSPAKIVVNLGVTGDVWVSTDKGLFHSTDSGTSFSTIAGVSQAWAIALGAPAKTGGYPAIFAAANVGGVGYFRSDDQGANWVQINDASHGFGSASSNCLTADPRIYGRSAYMPSLLCSRNSPILQSVHWNERSRHFLRRCCRCSSCTHLNFILNCFIYSCNVYNEEYDY